MTHPSIQGLREAAENARRAELAKTGLPDRIEAAGWNAQAAYLTEHGALLSGEGLVREVYVVTENLDYQGGTVESVWTDQEMAEAHAAGIDRSFIDSVDIAAFVLNGLVPVPQDGEPGMERLPPHDPTCPLAVPQDGET